MPYQHHTETSKMTSIRVAFDAGWGLASAAKRLYASTLELQYSACVSPYKCLLHIFKLYGYLSLAALGSFSPIT